MTIEKVLKLSNIQYPEDLAWRIDSYDAGHPKCLCSACGQLVKSSESFLEQDNYFDAADNSLGSSVKGKFSNPHYKGTRKIPTRGRDTHGVLSMAGFNQKPYLDYE